MLLALCSQFLHYAPVSLHTYLRTCVVQTAKVQLKDAKDRLLEQDNRIAEQTKLIAEFTLKVCTHVCAHIRTYVHTCTHILISYALNQ